MENEDKPKQDRKPSIVIDCDDSETNSLPVAGNAIGQGRMKSRLKTQTFANGLDQTVG